jgi:DNA-directed RNA polymerase alpha subunit
MNDKCSNIYEVGISEERGEIFEDFMIKKCSKLMKLTPKIQESQKASSRTYIKSTHTHTHTHTHTCTHTLRQIMKHYLQRTKRNDSKLLIRKSTGKKSLEQYIKALKEKTVNLEYFVQIKHQINKS